MIAIYGSPRKGGNSEILLDAFLGPVEPKMKVVKFRLGEMELQPCISCGHCSQYGKCIFNDDIEELFQAIESSDKLVIASPIFFTTVPAQVKSFVDRAQSYWERKRLADKDTRLPAKKGFFLAVGAMKTERYFQNARMVIKSLMNTLDISYTGELFYPGVDAKGAIRDIPGALDQAEAAGAVFAADL
ncbi:MAG TPA: flavodoxin family protein [Clostridiales bacterium]|nr:flavodoxin family protein [Clostridiales bacterium]